MKVYIDSDVLIWHLRGKTQATEFLRGLRSKAEYELWIGAMQRAEIVFFMRPDEEDSTLLFLSLFKTAPVGQEVIDTAGRLYRQWHPSHGIDVHDAILAATAMLTGGKIYSLNLKHFPMPDLLVEKAW
jgi:predicted nucleic acid-binding protein